MAFFSNIFNKFKETFNQEKPQSKTDSGVLAPEADPIVDEAYLENFEEELIRSDLGVKLAIDFSQIAKEKAKKANFTESQLKNLFKDFLLNAFKKLPNQDKIFSLPISSNTITVLLIVGVNGAGKTTSIGKLAHHFKKQGQKVLIAAGDTFRAAAEEQLNIWSQRAQVDLVQLEPGAKSSTVVFKAIEQAKEQGHNIVIIDTAGRLQSKQNLMDELTKLKQVIEKNLDGHDYHLETMLVLDASTGSNALSQAEKFNEATKLDSLILTKFDGSAKAGMVFALAYNFKLPVKFIGVGEKIEDIKEFDFDDFIAKYFT